MDIINNMNNKHINLDLLNNLNVYLVGGAVRDELLGIFSTERDWVVVGSNEKQMLSVGFQKVGKDFPVFIHPYNGEEYALARRERKTNKGYYGFQCDSSPKITLEEDLLRRDLTINAIAKDLHGNIIDPYNGLQDLKTRTLRHVSSAFIEDPVRVLRVARFAAKFAKLSFKIAPETMELMRSIVAQQELKYVTPERVWKEIEKSLITDNPEEFFLQLKEANALEQLLPDLNKLWGIPQNPIWHPEVDTGLHTILAVQQAVKLTKDPKIRFAVLCHDLGKSKTKPNLWPKHYGHEKAGAELIENLSNKYKIPNSYRKLAILVAKWHLHSHMALELTPGKILKLFISLNAFRQPENLNSFLLACKADATGRYGKEKEEYVPEKFLFKVFEEIRKVSAKEFALHNISGQQLGELIRRKQITLIKLIKKQWLKST